jgi:DNA glycosylase AlkZ-like
VSADVLATRFQSQLLGERRGADAGEVCERLLAVQAQDLRCARLAIRARTSGLTVTDVDRRLNDGSLVIGWLNRGTLHLVRREDYWWLHALTAPPLFAANARRLAQTGVTAEDAERGVVVIERALGEGPLSRDQLRGRLDAARVPTAGQALVHLLMLACLRGIAVRGPFVDRRHAYVLAAQWVGPPRPVEREAALAELARRYLIGHAPATDRDLAKWAGLPLRDARVGLTAIQDALVERSDGLLELEDTAGDGAPRACLLDRWDPVLVGWQSRERLLAHYPRLDSPEAHYRPFAYVSGQAVALWRLRGSEVELEEPFIALTHRQRRALTTDAADLVRFLAPAASTPAV